MKQSGKPFIAISLFLCASCAILSSSARQRGEQLFHDPTLGNGTTGKSCNTCHSNGRGIRADFDSRKGYLLMGLEIDTLAEVISSCNEMTMRGEGIEPDDSRLQDLISYMKTIARPNSAGQMRENAAPQEGGGKNRRE